MRGSEYRYHGNAERGSEMTDPAIIGNDAIRSLDQRAGLLPAQKTATTEIPIRGQSANYRIDAMPLCLRADKLDDRIQPFDAQDCELAHVVQRPIARSIVGMRSNDDPRLHGVNSSILKGSSIRSPAVHANIYISSC